MYNGTMATSPGSRRISANELLAMYAAGQRDFQGCDLSGESLAGHHLDQIILTDATLIDVRLDGASLCFANLQRANLTAAHLHRVNLLDADLSESVLKDVSAEGAMMIGANLTKSDLRSANLNYCAMAGVCLDGADLSGAELVATNLSGAKLVEARMNASMCETVLCDVNLADAHGLAYVTHTGESYVDIATLKKTASAVGDKRHRLGALIQFLENCGVTRARLAALLEPDIELFQQEVVVTSLPSPTSAFEPAHVVRGRYLANDPLREFSLDGMCVSDASVADLVNAIDNAEREEDIQQFLSERPELLIQHLGGGGHGRWTIAKKRLGCEHVTDFMICARDSLGFHWTAVELESPHRKLFTIAGNPAEFLTHAIRQILDWRIWLTKNIDYATRLREESGLGLTDITGNVPGLILIGRRAGLDGSTRQLRERLSLEHNISIHTYDYLVDAARAARR